MAARPLLQLIHHQIAQRREAAGASVQLEHVRAHSAAADIHSVGNRLTDYKANIARLRPQSATPSTLRELPLAECEHHTTVWTEHGIGQQVIDDVRRTALAQLRARQLNSWRSKPPADTMDGTFACSALLDTSPVVLTAGTATELYSCTSPSAPFSTAGSCSRMARARCCRCGAAHATRLSRCSISPRALPMRSFETASATQ